MLIKDILRQKLIVRLVSNLMEVLFIALDDRNLTVMIETTPHWNL